MPFIAALLQRIMQQSKINFEGWELMDVILAAWRVFVFQP
jgi:hypothetical protein